MLKTRVIFYPVRSAAATAAARGSVNALGELGGLPASRLNLEALDDGRTEVIV